LTRWTIKELELAVNAGRYDVASAYLRDYKPKSPNARDLAKLAELKAKVELLQPRFALAQQLLRDLIDQQTGGDIRNAFRATLGVPLATTWLLPPPNPELAPLLTAAETILPEFHPDSLGRIEFFIDLAEQAESRRKAGKEPSNKPEQLLALAITGWLKGKNGAEKDLKNAIRCWNTRQFAIQHLKEEGENKRAIELRKYLAGPDKLPADELSQIISLLPPIEAEDLSQISNQARDPKLTEGIANIVVRKTPNTPAAGNISYAFRLPPEYHHGRPYPLIIILTQPGIPVEKLVAGLAPDAAKNGYILAGLEWGDRGNRAYDYSGDHHADVQALIREMSRKFMIDPDKVFLFGYLDGANFALDMGVSHPDLFAGVVAMGPNIIGSFYGEYWKNAQKLPVYSVVGEISGTAFSNLRTVYERWLPLGFPGLMTIYKGRGNEWFASEIGTIFDWMNRKSRARGTSSLRLNDVRFEAWQSMRYSDQRFYWIEFNTINPVNTLKPNRPNYPPYPAQIRADIKKGNEIVLSDIRGVKQLTIYLERDMIDWTSKVSITVPGAKKKWTPQELTPDPGVMFEHLYRTGDRKMLFFGKVEFELY
jgi:pimeloyl-ACP methyl ester carboxylesterase